MEDRRKLTTVAAVENLTDRLVLAPGTKVYAVTLKCGCSSTVFEPPEAPPLVGTAAVCYSVDGSHVRYVPNPGRLADLRQYFRRMVGTLTRARPQ